MSLLILAPTGAATAYGLAAKAFQTMYEKVTGINIALSETDDGCSDLVAIGSDSVNDFLMQEVLELRLAPLGIRYGTDDYCIHSHKAGTRNVLILAGGRGRSTLYAVYDYFARFAGCRYFWDGDVIPRQESLPMEDICVNESPRFEYRGTRYFAHRGLKRFQAEHWSLEDWKRELDWLTKRRLNFFMLRIGMDDIWQRAFPEAVPYAEGFETVDGQGYNDRSDFWTLEYRGWLRQQVLAYARDLDLTFPVDCGTMTHWYSPTPRAFLENMKPKFAIQEVARYTASDTGRVLDFTQKDMMGHYMKLTETMVNEHEMTSELFHTIGLGERTMYLDGNKNFALKKIAYRRIAEEIRRRYPHSKLMLAGWDFVGWWREGEVSKLVQELDPERTLILDYTAEVADPNSSFLNWGIVGKFPWIFGIFHAFEAESELRGPYDRIEERFQAAIDDPYCKGMILWPELSHSDPLILEYLAQNAWVPSGQSVEQIIQTMCRDRYGRFADYMNACWQAALPVIKLSDWGSRTQRTPDVPNYEDYCNMPYGHQDIWVKLTMFLTDADSESPVLRKFYQKRIAKYRAVNANAVAALKGLLAEPAGFDDPFVFRDTVDLVRTVLGRYMNLLVMLALEAPGQQEYLQKLKKAYVRLMEIMGQLLSLSPEFSMYETLEALKQTAPVNPDFEITLKHNLCNRYCFQPAYEPVTHLYIHEAEAGFNWLLSDRRDKEALAATRKALVDGFMKTPLAAMVPDALPDLAEVIRAAIAAVSTAADLL